MAIVREIVSHILHHVDAEASSTDESQTDGVPDRADYVLDAIDTFTDDERDIEVVTWLREFALEGKPGRLRGSFRRMLMNAEDDPRPRLVIQEWVGKNTERRGG